MIFRCSEVVLIISDKLAGCQVKPSSHGKHFFKHKRYLLAKTVDP